MSGTLFIDVNSIRQNIINAKQKIGKAKICGVVKANCYGMGVELCSHINNLVDYFAVSSVWEAIELSNIVADKPILVLAPPSNKEIDALSKIYFPNIELAVESISTLKYLISTGKVYRIHIAANTGMNRYGCGLKTLDKMLKILKDNPNIKVVGLFSHFYKNTSSIMKKQFNRFKPFIKRVCIDYPDVLCHISNSHGLDYSLDMVRLGIEMYSPSDTNCLKLVSNIKSTKKIRKGEIVSYNGTFKADKLTRIAIVPLGYADGIMRKLGGGNVVINGKLCPIVGDICMDCFMVDISLAGRVKTGDQVVIFGEDGKERISVCNLAEICDTISYELLTRLGSRINREYMNAGNNR